MFTKQFYWNTCGKHGWYNIICSRKCLSERLNSNWTAFLSVLPGSLKKKVYTHTHTHTHTHTQCFAFPVFSWNHNLQRWNNFQHDFCVNNFDTVIQIHTECSMFFPTPSPYTHLYKYKASIFSKFSLDKHSIGNLCLLSFWYIPRIALSIAKILRSLQQNHDSRILGCSQP
jgi:hypothetical protein